MIKRRTNTTGRIFTRCTLLVQTILKQIVILFRTPDYENKAVGTYYASKVSRRTEEYKGRLQPPSN